MSSPRPAPAPRRRLSAHERACERSRRPPLQCSRPPAAARWGMPRERARAPGKAARTACAAAPGCYRVRGSRGGAKAAGAGRAAGQGASPGVAGRGAQAWVGPCAPRQAGAPAPAGARWAPCSAGPLARAAAPDLAWAADGPGWPGAHAQPVGALFGRRPAPAQSAGRRHRLECMTGHLLALRWPTCRLHGSLCAAQTPARCLAAQPERAPNAVAALGAGRAGAARPPRQPGSATAGKAGGAGGAAGAGARRWSSTETLTLPCGAVHNICGRHCTAREHAAPFSTPPGRCAAGRRPTRARQAFQAQSAPGRRGAAQASRQCVTGDQATSSQIAHVLSSRPGQMQRRPAPAAPRRTRRRSRAGARPPPRPPPRSGTARPRCTGARWSSPPPRSARRSRRAGAPRPAPRSAAGSPARAPRPSSAAAAAPASGPDGPSPCRTRGRPPHPTVLSRPLCRSRLARLPFTGPPQRP